MNLFYQPSIDQGVLHLDEEESKHCIKVLRKQQGEIIRITDGKRNFYDAVILNGDPRHCTFSIQKKIGETPRDFSIHIAISPTKNADRIEWFVEKSVEMGIDQITLLHCKHSERNYLKTERLKKVAISAIKQSFKATLPAIHDVVAYDTFVKSIRAEEKFVAFVDSTNPIHLKNAAKPKHSSIVLIGPEGDFAEEELQLAMENNFIKVSLGNSRLRTETAGIAACHILNLING